MVMVLRDAVAIAALALVLLPSRGARADGPGDEAARAQADAEFNEGKKLLDSGQTAAACARFARSQDLDPKLGRLLNLAFCHEQEGKTASAWNEYNAAAALAAQKSQPDRVDFAREHATAVAKRLSFIHLDVPAGVWTVQVDGSGVTRDRWAMPLPLDPGTHRVVASAPGKRPESLSVNVPADPGVLEVGLAPLQDSAPRQAAPAGAPAASAPQNTPANAPVGAPEPEPVSSGNGSSGGEGHASHLPAFLVGGVGVAGLAVGVGAGVVAMSKKSDADAQCPAKQCNPAGHELISDARTAATISTVGFGVGVAGAAVATWLFLRESSSDSKSAHLTPVLGPRTAGLGLEGAW
jgi:hypothetical protein